jgi:hypothetical protein
MHVLYVQAVRSLFRQRYAPAPAQDAAASAGRTVSRSLLDSRTGNNSASSSDNGFSDVESPVKPARRRAK